MTSAAAPPRRCSERVGLLAALLLLPATAAALAPLRPTTARWSMTSAPATPPACPVPVAASHRPVVFCGPSGVGKGTIINSLMTTFPDSFAFAVSHTTRAPRAGEQDGREYHFADHAAMEAAIEAGEFLEHARVHGNLYGTSKSAIEQISASGRVCLLDLDVQGVQSLQERQDQLCLFPHFVFITPPSIDDLRVRLLNRNTESPEQITRRLSAAEGEIEWGLRPGIFDVTLVNKQLDPTIKLAEQAMLSFFPHLRRSGTDVEEMNLEDRRRELERITALSAAAAAL